VHICELVEIADSLGLDPQDGELVNQLPGRDIDLNRSALCSRHGVESGAACYRLNSPNPAARLRANISRKVSDND
jgi:hypothetical protein